MQKIIQTNLGRPLEEFKPFCRLPVELRGQIWQAALQSTPVSKVCVLKPVKASGASKAHKVVALQRKPYTSLLQTCGESREVALAYAGSSAYDPDVDILYISSQTYDAFTSPTSPHDRQWLNFLAQVRHLAIAHSLTDRSIALRFTLPYLEKLETLSVVYSPSSPAEPVDVHADVLPPTGDTPLLLGLTETELEKFTIRADYVYGTWYRDLEIRWTKSAKQHLDDTEKKMTWDMCPGNSVGVARLPPYWDHDAEKLRLNFEARRFAQGD